MGTPTNSSSELMLIHLGGVYSIVTICCNLFLILVILSKVELRGQRDNFFMVSLSIANVLVGVAFTFKILRDVDTDDRPNFSYIEVCHAVKGLVVFSLAASVYNFLALAFERWLMLRWEMERWEEVEESRLMSRKLVVAIVWGLSLCQALPVWASDTVNNTTPECTFRQMDAKWLVFALVTIFILPSLLLILLHVLMLRQVVAHSSDLVVFYQFRLLSIITGVFMVSWWPVIAYLCVTWSTNTLQDSIAVYWAQLNCLADPLIYLLAHDSVRNRAMAILTLLPCCTRRRRREGYQQIG